MDKMALRYIKWVSLRRFIPRKSLDMSAMQDRLFAKATKSCIAARSCRR